MRDKLLYEKPSASHSAKTLRGEVRVLASQNTWIEGLAVGQLEKTAALPGMKLAVGLPDLHPGKGSPIGAAFLTDGWIYPALVGNDIGCGIGLWRTELSAAKPKRETWSDRLRDLDGAWDGNATGWLAARGIEPSGYEAAWAPSVAVTISLNCNRLKASLALGHVSNWA